MNKMLLAGLSAAFLAVSASGLVAQTKLSRNEIINSLQGAQQKVDLTADELQKAALENIQKYPGANAPNTLPLADKLASLRQFNVEITFDFDSARIRPESYETVGLIADALHTPYLQGQTFFIVGHTDAKGAREYNLELSLKRAQAVREALVTTFRVPGDYLFAVGLGEEQLRDPSKPDAAINRRVQLINLGYR
ncbi:flagellar motor protein MotB [Roseibium algicola]|uniref:Flagellar motor protein MotB n=2 Tax=Roseibium TaxID=150830 RepID=A0ABM6I1E8_9HYPH|nr:MULTISPECIES: OmpA family protein [Stappiaceae]AQQ04183.1 flagellar motor protein MotB [Roseibium aggregatum]NKX63974.1 OmpA family protein [Labrenzia sp. 5N]UES55592.1 OmpA family protein [Roseibium aggregatum]